MQAVTRIGVGALAATISTTNSAEVQISLTTMKLGVIVLNAILCHIITSVVPIMVEMPPKQHQ